MNKMQSLTTCSHIEVERTLPPAIDSGKNDRSKSMNGAQERIEDFGGGHVGFFEPRLLFRQCFREQPWAVCGPVTICQPP